jgi:uncharacterized protein YhbP (UPF0306 family)
MKLANIGAYNVVDKEVAKAFGEEQVRNIAFRINVLCAMATVTREGRAHVNTAYLCYSDELELFFLSHPSATHCRNILHNPSMAMAIFSSSHQWVGPVKGIQLFGTCSQVMGSHAAKAEELYGRRFSAYASWKASRKQEDFAREYQIYCFVVRRLKILDEATFGEAVFVSADVIRT